MNGSCAICIYNLSPLTREQTIVQTTWLWIPCWHDFEVKKNQKHSPIASRKCNAFSYTALVKPSISCVWCSWLSFSDVKGLFNPSLPLVLHSDLETHGEHYLQLFTHRWDSECTSSSRLWLQGSACGTRSILFTRCLQPKYSTPRVSILYIYIFSFEATFLILCIQISSHMQKACYVP